MPDRPTRWETDGPGAQPYAARFAALIEEGTDIDGEARLADVLVPRGARILDAGSGTGRVGAALVARGHRVVAVEKDPGLVAESRSRYPALPVLEADLLALDAVLLAQEGLPTAYDLVVAVGNVLVLLAPDSERRVLARLRALLAPGGRLLVGFHTGSVPDTRPVEARDTTLALLRGDAGAAGLVVDQHYGGYDLRPDHAAYVVAVLSPTSPTSPTSTPSST